MDFHAKGNMNLLIHSNLNDPHYFTHGFGALMNKALLICWLHYEKYGNWNVRLDDPFISPLFNFPKIEADYKKNLVWDGDGPKVIDKNRAALNNVFKPNDKVLITCLNLINEVFTEKTIGIHARGTDKSTEAPRLQIETIIQFATPYVQKGYSIFLATDERYYLYRLINHFGQDVVKHDQTANISTDGNPIHLGDASRSLAYYDAFRAAFLLSRTDVLLYCNSNLSELARAMASEETACINMQP